MMADAADAGNEQHRRWHARCQNLRVMRSSAGHKLVLTWCVRFGRLLQRLLKRRIHRRGCAGAGANAGYLARAGIAFGHQTIQRRRQAVQQREIGVAELEQHLRPARHDARGARFQRDSSAGPYRA